MKVNDVDKVYILTCLDKTNRINNSIQLSNDLAKYIDRSKIIFNFSVLYPDYMNDIKLNPDTDSSFYQLDTLAILREYYRIIKEAQYFNYNYIMICEDDVYINENLTDDYKSFLFNNLPNGADVIRLDYNNENFDGLSNTTPPYFVKNEYGYWGNLCIILSKKAIRYFINYFNDENNINPADYIWFINDENSDLKMVRLTKQLFKEHE